MEVGDQSVDHRKCVAGLDKQSVLTGSGGDRSMGARRRFECPQRSGPHGGHAPTSLFGTGNRVNGGLRNLVALGMHGVFGQGFDAYRLKGAGAHLEGDPRDLDATLAQGS